ncbi:MAG: 30.4 kDa unknown protein [Plant associated soymovirus 1]|nr:MAG: 30.4 kDa unknown protein [Plant associated soymovirus 1]
MTKDRIRDWIERKFDKLHRLTDKLPLGILDGVLHGTSRGIINFLTDHHPQKTKPSPSNQSVYPEIEEFISFFLDRPYSHRFSEKYPIRFNLFINHCRTYNDLARLLHSIERGITIHHQQLGSVKFSVNNLYSCYMSLKGQLTELDHKVAEQTTLISKLGGNEQKILMDLELISNNLKLLRFNHQKDVQHLIDSYISEFNKDLNQIKTLIKNLDQDVKVVKATTSNIDKKVTHIEELSERIAFQQNELRKLIDQLIGNDH